MLEAAAAARWKVPIGEVEAKNHEVVHRPTGRRLGYGTLAKAAADMPVPRRETIRLKDPSQFRYIGKGELKLVDGPDIVTGKAQYGIDTRLPGMLYAVVARPPVYGGKVASYDAAEALKVPGVVRVVQIEASSPPAQFNPLGGVAVVARNTWAAMQGRKALKIVWDDGPNARYDSAAYKATLEASAHSPGKVVRNDGDFSAAVTGAAQPYRGGVLHPAPRPCDHGAARCNGAHCEGQVRRVGLLPVPQAARDLVAKRLGIPFKDVTVHVTLLGGGFGRKSKPDYGVEAAVLSKAMDGKPVKVTWTRETTCITTTSTRSPSSIWKRDSTRKAGPWRGCTAASPRPSCRPSMRTPRRRLTGNSAWAFINVPFSIPNIRIENPAAVAHTRIGWFRAVSNIPHAFAVQSFVAELAAAARRDPKDFLLEVIGPAREINPKMLGDTWNHGESPERYPVDTGRLRRVVETAAREAGWGKTLPKGRGLGIAGHYSFVSYIAAVVEVAVDDKGVLTIPRVDVAVDCGACINPDRVRSQMEGAVVMGVGVAMQSEISFKDGRAQQDNFHAYEVTRLTGAPREIRVHIIPGDFAKPLGGVRRTGRAADSTGAVQRNLRGDGETHPAAADPRPVESLSGYPASVSGALVRCRAGRPGSSSSRSDDARNDRRIPAQAGTQCLCPFTPSPHPRLRLLSQILRQIVDRAGRLAGRSGTFPPPERLIARPCAGRRTLRPVRVAHACLDAHRRTLPSRRVRRRNRRSGHSRRRSLARNLHRSWRPVRPKQTERIPRESTAGDRRARARSSGRRNGRARESP